MCNSLLFQATFLEDIRTFTLCRDSPDTLDDLVECYNDTLNSLLDKHALVRARYATTRIRPPWFNDEIMKVRRDRRSAERRWRASGLDSGVQGPACESTTLHLWPFEGQACWSVQPALRWPGYASGPQDNAENLWG